MSRIAPSEPEPIDATPRRKITGRDRLDLFVAQKGRCALCGEKRLLSEFDLDHRIPLELGGSDEPANWQFICRDTCHRKKTSTDRKAISKAARIRRRLAGEERPKAKIRSRGFFKDPLKQP